MFYNRIIFIAMLFMLINLACTYNSNRPVDNDWKKDKCGCKHLRSITMANRMIENYKLKGNSKKAFLNIFGEPDTAYTNGKDENLIYYWGSICFNGHITNESDKCWADFNFKSDKLVSVSFPCE
jgi:hypothetical protein